MDAPIIHVHNIVVGAGHPLFFLLGPCVLEELDDARRIAAFLKELSIRLGFPFCFKGSFDKANRSAISSFRGPGMEKGLEILAHIQTEFELPVISDIHAPEQASTAARVLDIIQIPAFLCRQTDLLTAAGRTGKPVNIKKGQFLAPWDMKYVLEKAASTGNRNLLLTERGSMFGYNNLVVDFRGISIMRNMGAPVIFDATHSVQLPGGRGGSSGGQREFVAALASAAVSAGADAVFMEVYPDPDKALCDGPNSIALADLEPLLRRLMRLREICNKDMEDHRNQSLFTRKLSS